MEEIIVKILKISYHTDILRLLPEVVKMSKLLQRFEVQVNNESYSVLLPVQLLVTETSNSGVLIPVPQTESVIEDSSGTINSNSRPDIIQKIINESSEYTVPSNVIPQQKLNEKAKRDKIEKNDVKKKHKQIVEINHNVHIPDQIVPSRAIGTLPAALYLEGGAIYPKRFIPPLARFGPVQGVTMRTCPAEASKLVQMGNATGTPIFLLKRTAYSVYVIDTDDKDKSNWLSLLPLGNESTANVWLYEVDDALYGITVAKINRRTPLALGYSKSYAENHSILSGPPVLDLDEVIVRLKAGNDLADSPSCTKVYKKTNQRVPRKGKGYRCTHCLLRFTRLFSYKRHLALYCRKKPDESNTSLEQTHRSDTEVKALDESQVPSDESFQNYTNNLDFSTNLFGAQLNDRLPNLDLSSSRSDVEFNPYSLGNEILDLETSDNLKKPQPKAEEKIVINCPHCDMTMLKEVYRFHYRDCQKRRFVCECGLKLNNEEKLSQHILKEHTQGSKEDKRATVRRWVHRYESEGSLEDRARPQPLRLIQPQQVQEMAIQKEPNGDGNNAYSCDKCGSSFKRRGMLVNHLWRVHGAAAAASAGPLWCRESRYPCVAPGCDKVYRSAAKRDVHIRGHHPGYDPRTGQSVQGSSWSCAAAACPACPRQYATHAKLIQHVRVHHPQLAMDFIKNRKQSPKEKIISSRDRTTRILRKSKT